jgi:hypothetical protein
MSLQKINQKFVCERKADKFDDVLMSLSRLTVYFEM